ncbi:MAG: hypothetical protein AB7I01_10675 [Gammaproteobacteria bacterium]
MPLLDFLERHSDAATGAVVAAFVLNALVFYVAGRRAEKRFRDHGDQPVRFRERGASGHSLKSIVTKLGGANAVLEVVVTDQEVWLKGIWPMFSYIGSRFDMTHRIPKSSVRACAVLNETVELRFISEKGEDTHVVLELKDPVAFKAALEA